jgi:hypothetical protein
MTRHASNRYCSRAAKKPKQLTHTPAKTRERKESQIGSDISLVIHTKGVELTPKLHHGAFAVEDAEDLVESP